MDAVTSLARVRSGGGCVVAAILLAAVAVGSASARADEAGGVVARVGGVPISRNDLQAVLTRSGVGHLADRDKRLEAEAAALEQLVEERLMQAAVNAAGIESPAADVDATVARLRAQATAQGTTLEAFLAQTGRDEPALRSQVALELRLQKLLGPRVTVAALEELFEKNRRELDGTQLRIAHIVLRPDLGQGDDGVAACLERAGRIRREILRGDISFADAARKYSAGPSRHRGGDLGLAARHGGFIEEFARQAFAIAKGDISKPFVTPFGVHLVAVIDVQPGRLDAAAVRPQLERMLSQNLLRETLAKTRLSTPVAYAAGVPHFDPAGPAGGSGPRPVVVDGVPAGR